MIAPVDVWAAVVVVASAAFGLCAPGVARCSPGRAATWLLSAGSVLVAGSAVVVPAIFVFVALGQIRFFAGIAGWSASSLAAWFPIRWPVAVMSAVVLAAQLTRSSKVLTGRGRRLMRAWQASRTFDTSLVVIPSDQLVAFALPGWPGRVIASRRLLQTLDGTERRALLAHEQAHLDQRHDLHRAAAAMAAAVNPMLSHVPAAVRLATERWADETAAHAIGDRERVAATIDRVAATTSGLARLSAMAMGVGDADVALRVAALLSQPRHRRPIWEALLVAVAVLAVAAALIGLYDTKQVFETAEQAYLHARSAR
ncbi:MAG: M48 family metalloprotease [Acidimicrobiales bacterium]|nr:M48 family metalloprotease [Acidimicrobiales bacterium]